MIYLVVEDGSLYDLQSPDIVVTESVHDCLRRIPSKSIQIDTETSIVNDNDPNWLYDRELYVVQIGDMEGNIQILFDIPRMAPAQIADLITYLNDKKLKVLGHNMAFDYLVLKTRLGVELKNIHDTYLMASILRAGIESVQSALSLKGLLMRELNVDISKAAQTTFNGDLLTEEQIHYAATDVKYLKELFNRLYGYIQKEDLEKVYNLERKVLPGLVTMQTNRMRFDKERWTSLANKLIAKMKQSELLLNQLVMSDTKLVKYLKTHKIGDTYLIQPVDTYNFNWQSKTFRENILPLLIPALKNEKDLTKPTLTKLYKAQTLTKDENELLWAYLSRNFDKLEELLIKDYSAELKDLGYYIPENTININWASPVHKLKIFSFNHKSLTQTNAKALNRIKKDPLIKQFKEYVSMSKMVSSYGLNFINKYVDRYGLIGPSKLKQILSTGRISYGILLQIPANNEFRNAILPPEGYKFVDTDYSSMEVVIMAVRAQEPNFLKAIKEGRDLHSMSAKLMFPEEWKKGALELCKYDHYGKKCSCPEHQKLRQFSKAITFGLVYGMTEHGLAQRLDISNSEAEELMNRFFKTFPKLKAMLDRDAEFGKKNLYIVGMPPLNRKEYFTKPLYANELESIGRESKNFPIQSANADIIKLTILLLYQKIREDNLPAMLHLPVHDEILSSAKEGFVEKWKEIQEEAMIQAATLYIKREYVRLETKITDLWTK